MINNENMYGKKKSICGIFMAACRDDFLSYGMFLIKKNKIDIHAYNELAFRYSCHDGHIQIARW